MNPGFTSDVAVIEVAVPSGRARSLAPSEVAIVAGPLTPMNGIVTVKGTPSSGFDVIGPSSGGKFASLLTMITATAPACWPKIALATRAHVPRFTTAIVLAGSGPPNAATEQPSASLTGVAGLSWITFSAPLTAGFGCSLALMPWIASVPAVMFTPGNVCVGSLAAVAIEPAPVPGDPVMYWFGPLLPAEVTTITPAFAALVDATADGSSLEPNGEPSDMLITSMSLSTAHSIASTVTSVEPRQPKTRTP